MTVFRVDTDDKKEDESPSLEREEKQDTERIYDLYFITRRKLATIFMFFPNFSQLSRFHMVEIFHDLVKLILIPTSENKKLLKGEKYKKILNFIFCYVYHTIIFDVQDEMKIEQQKEKDSPRGIEKDEERLSQEERFELVVLSGVQKRMGIDTIESDRMFMKWLVEVYMQRFYETKKTRNDDDDNNWVENMFKEQKKLYDVDKKNKLGLFSYREIIVEMLNYTSEFQEIVRTRKRKRKGVNFSTLKYSKNLGMWGVVTRLILGQCLGMGITFAMKHWKIHKDVHHSRLRKMKDKYVSKFDEKKFKRKDMCLIFLTGVYPYVKTEEGVRTFLNILDDFKEEEEISCETEMLNFFLYLKKLKNEGKLLFGEERERMSYSKIFEMFRVLDGSFLYYENPFVFYKHPKREEIFTIDEERKLFDKHDLSSYDINDDKLKKLKNRLDKRDRKKRIKEFFQNRKKEVKEEEVIQCGFCEKDLVPSNSKVCGGCMKVFYCNKICAKSHWVVHKVSCQMEMKCANCSKTGKLKTCSCKKVFYCSKTCQAKNWGKHKLEHF